MTALAFRLPQIAVSTACAHAHHWEFAGSGVEKSKEINEFCYNTTHAHTHAYIIKCAYIGAHTLVCKSNLMLLRYIPQKIILEKDLI